MRARSGGGNVCEIVPQNGLKSTVSKENGVKRMTNVKKLLLLDGTLSYLAAERTASAMADDLAKAHELDAQWAIFDEQRQAIIARASDRELVDYEIQRQ
jgi:hypothetical protein